MKTTIDRAGRVVIPKEVREQVGLTPGTEVEVRAVEGIVEIIAPRPQGRIIKEGPVWVWEPDTGTRQVTQEEINDAIREVREERERKILEGGY
jgi:AbrB family looped-hinge helix DNA binding protein